MKLKKHILCGWLALAGAAAFTACDDLFREIDIFRNDITLLNNRFVSPLSSTCTITPQPLLLSSSEVSITPHCTT